MPRFMLSREKPLMAASRPRASDQIADDDVAGEGAEFDASPGVESFHSASEGHQSVAAHVVFECLRRWESREEHEDEAQVGFDQVLADDAPALGPEASFLARDRCLAGLSGGSPGACVQCPEKHLLVRILVESLAGLDPRDNVFRELGCGFGADAAVGDKPHLLGGDVAWVRM